MQSNPGAKPNKRILIVDDNEDAAEMLFTVMNSLGYESRSINHGTDCLDVALVFKPDVIFLDIGMPDLNGIDVARQLRQHPSLKNVCIAAVTGWSDTSTKDNVKRAGFNFHIVKPANLDELLHVIDFCEMSQINWFEPLVQKT